jgi:hypothetical protein
MPATTYLANRFTHNCSLTLAIAGVFLFCKAVAQTKKNAAGFLILLHPKEQTLNFCQKLQSN